MVAEIGRSKVLEMKTRQGGLFSLQTAGGGIHLSPWFATVIKLSKGRKKKLLLPCKFNE